MQKASVVLITGASSGIGCETAVYLAERGFQVCASMRDLRRRADLDAEARERGVELDVLQLDVTDRSSIDRAVNQTIERYGRIDGLVNNAGVQLRGFFEDLADAEIRGLFDTNVFGTMAVTAAVLPHMRQARCGRIVIVTSVGGRIGGPALSSYCASKFALEGFGEALALETRSFGIRVALVAPAIVQTSIWNVNRHIGGSASDPQSPYSTWFAETERLADRLVATSPTRPVDVARSVQHALTAPRPRLRYLVGWRAGIVVALRRYLPERLFERIYFGQTVRRMTRGVLVDQP
jgi:NAD(P)-dependent dehydrogenase (short-subunit alcohol dehydrogenase family)